MPDLPDHVDLGTRHKVVHAGTTDYGDLVADEIGLAVDVTKGEGFAGRKNRMRRRYYLAFWAEVIAYELARAAPRGFSGSTINNHSVILTLTTKAKQLSIRLHHTDVARVRDQMGRYLSGVGAAGMQAADPASPVTAPDPFEQLSKLAALRDRGILTEDEFQAKKAEILNRM
jgi:hypothetical protein